LHWFWKTITFVTGLRQDGIAPFVVDGANDVPTLGRRDIVITDKRPV
jgi:hypothetical protein